MGALLIAACVLPIHTARGATDEIDHSGVVIQNRLYKLVHELSLGVGLLPVDAYYKGVLGTVSYTLHLDDFSAWEALSVGYSFNWDSRLKESLVEEFGASPDKDYEFREAVLVINSNYVMKPLYGKMAFFNRLVVRSELYLTSGPAFMLYTPSSMSFYGLSYRPGINYGMGLRIFTAPWFSVRFDLRHYVVVAVDALFLDQKERRLEIDNLLLLGLGGSFNLGYD